MTQHDPAARAAPGSQERTGRYLLSFPTGEGPALSTALRDQAGLRSVATAADVGASAGDLPDVLLLPHLSAAVLSADPDRLAAVTRLCRQLPLAPPEPERWVYPASATPPVDPQLLGYLRGYRDGVASVVDRLVEPSPVEAPAAVDGALTWGLQVLGVEASSRTGRGVKAAVLDTGLDAEHPDLGGRAVAAASFVAGEGCDDVLGHGTHCAGTLCGPRTPVGPTRYGVAPDVELYVAKVLGADGRGREGDVLAGVDWAVGQGCRVVSMSLGSRAVPGEPWSRVFEQVAAELAAASPGTVLVAAAGNDSERSRGVVAPLGRPASCPSVVAVAAVDPTLTVADFSNAGAVQGAGQVDVAAPGTAVLSAYPEPDGPYALLDGTSMATPHVAGVLALLAEAHPNAGVPELVRELARTARRLPASSIDVGSGLVRAPA